MTGSYPPLRCGVGDYASRLAASLAALPGMSVEVLTTGTEDAAEVVDGVVVRRAMKDWTLGSVSTFVSAIRRSRPDIVHVQYPTQGYADGWLPNIIPLLSRLLGHRVVQTWHEGKSIRRPVGALLKSIAGGGVVVVRPNYTRDNLHPLLRWALSGKTFTHIPNTSAVPRCSLTEAERLAARDILLQGQQRLVVFFGFVLPSKGAELVFEIADPATDRVVIAGEMGDASSARLVVERTQASPWKGKSQVLGFLPAEEAATLLAVADAVVLPFRAGGGEWNTSIHAATIQGTFVLTTSATRNGYFPDDNTFLARIDDIAQMREALSAHAGKRGAGHLPVSWTRIASEHAAIYATIDERPA